MKALLWTFKQVASGVVLLAALGSFLAVAAGQDGINKVVAFYQDGATGAGN